MYLYVYIYIYTYIYIYIYIHIYIYTHTPNNQASPNYGKIFIFLLEFVFHYLYHNNSFA